MSYNYPVLARLYIPKNPGQPVFDLEKQLCQHFNGYTLMSFAVGAYRMHDGSLCTEPVYVYDVVINGSSEAEALEYILLEYKKHADQECVLYVVNNFPIFI